MVCSAFVQFSCDAVNERVPFARQLRCRACVAVASAWHFVRVFLCHLCVLVTTRCVADFDAVAIHICTQKVEERVYHISGTCMFCSLFWCVDGC